MHADGSSDEDIEQRIGTATGKYYWGYEEGSDGEEGIQKKMKLHVFNALV